VNTFTLPVRPGNVGGASVLLMEEGDSEKVLQVFRGVDPAVPSDVVPAQVRVRVLNGSGVGGQAGQVADALGFVDFNVVGTGDAGSFDFNRTTIRYAPGKEAHARLLARYVEGGAAVEAADTVNSADVVLITGSGFTGILEQPTAADSPPPTSPPTTSAPATTAPDGGAAPQGDPAEEACG
jgi:hypothetical protein